MKKLLAIATILVFLAPGAASAALTQINPLVPNIEDFLAAEAGAGGIYNGASFTRVDDAFDQAWQALSGRFEIRMVANHAGFGELLGTDSGSLDTLWSEAPGQFYKWETFTVGTDPFGFRVTSKHNFKDPANPGAPDNWLPVFNWSSDPSGNIDLLDHMVAFRMDNTDTYILGWEDLPPWAVTPNQFADPFGPHYANGSDWDFNDLILEVNGASPVPIPGAIWLFSAGILGLIGIKKRRQ